MRSTCDCQSSDGRGGASVVTTGTLERPRYSPGLILEDADLTAAVDYTRELNRLMFRSLFGCGVVCGLGVSVKLDCDLIVTVAPGLALDGCGDPLHLPSPATISLGQRAGVLVKDGSAEPEKTDFWVVACQKEKNCAPRTLVCDGDDLDCGTQPTRTRSGVEISVVFEPPRCACGCRSFADRPDGKALDALANSIRQAPEGGPETGGAQERRSPAGPDLACHDAHYNDPGCPADCGCGTACSCGCCVLLAWVHWSAGEGGAQWTALHDGVRRFIRPAMIADPAPDGPSAKTAETKSDASSGSEAASERRQGARSARSRAAGNRAG